ncbi:SDR family NAD(P)-dependent oxidoreductase [Paenibacillus sp. GP183]|uniref:SDR family NAD(P)-dependent oxidoreductase n=1 Tax=Paenibacillus sp. GP183 TaxID=1882751 RepID=UPI00089B3E46|nr:SDR family NAD(P)-dependent oxidoreductase [Paenibacillus sp. GP183]SEB73273.1 3-oxoacyl-[acyl-carrier protein] reductase [Paenibacillus sp. GP183]
MVKNVKSGHSISFHGKVVIVSGAGHGFGKTICKEFAKCGASVYGTDVSGKELDETKQEIDELIRAEQTGGQIEVGAFNLTDPAEVRQLLSKVMQTYQGVHILVNNAGGVVGQVHQPVDQVTDEQWEQVVNINLKAVFYMIREVAPIMKKQQYGRIVNISSGAGRSFSLTGIQAYTSAKAGQIGLTRQMARELGAYGITVNNVAPGFVLSNPSTTKQWDAMQEEKQKQLLDAISLHRLGQAEEIAYPVVFLASDYASYINGQVISVDGGHHMF